MKSEDCEDGRDYSESSGRKVNLMIVASTLWIGGAETVMRHLAHAINPRRFKVTVCHLKQRGVVGDDLFREGVNIIGLPKAACSEVDYLTFLKLLKVIRARKIDVVHTHTTHGLVDSCLCKLVMPRLRVVHTFHFGNYPHTRTSIIWMERIFSRLADRLIAVGDIQRRQLQNLFSFSDRQISTIWNGVKIRSGEGDPLFRLKQRAENCVLVGTIATLIQQKGLSYLFDVAKAIRDSGRKAMFVVVGEGHLRAELEAKQRELGLEGTVVLTGWVSNAAEVALPTFDIFFQPSLWEAMSMVILEAMMAAKPIVATRVGENSKIIEDGVDGLLVQPKNTGEMAAAIGRLIDDAALRLRLGEAARAKVEHRFTVEHMTRAYENVYLNLMQ
jgi:glycosyltransferase involved in cell wall biosynthesis